MREGMDLLLCDLADMEIPGHAFMMVRELLPSGELLVLCCEASEALSFFWSSANK